MDEKTSVFKLHDRRYAVNGPALRERRERAGVTQTAFAEMCGWKPQYQCRLEHTTDTTINESAARVIDGVLSEIERDFERRNREARERFERNALDDRDTDSRG
jgi:transcriptional regulator with XRE-family HTH domain